MCSTEECQITERSTAHRVRCIEVLCRMQAQLNNGDNMKTLEEVQAQFESKNKAGNEINILAYHPGQQYPIIAEVKFEGVWEASCFNEHGADVIQLSALCNLIKKRPYLPKDILCEVWDNCFPDVRPKVYSDGTGLFFINGANSASSSGVTKWGNYRVIENQPQPWFGGECPIPEGCEYHIRVRHLWIKQSLPASSQNWGSSQYITAYQILGEKEVK